MKSSQLILSSLFAVTALADSQLMGFYAEWSGALQPVFGLKGKDFHQLYFLRGPIVDPDQFFFEDGHLVSAEKEQPGKIFFKGTEFGYGPSESGLKIEVNEDGILKGLTFKKCPDDYGFTIEDSSTNKNCSDVKLYLKPSNETVSKASEPKDSETNASEPKASEPELKNATTVVKETTTTSTVCVECETPAPTLVLNTYTRYTTHCPKLNTTVTVCDEECKETTVIPSTLTDAEVFVVEETPLANPSNETKASTEPIEVKKPTPAGPEEAPIKLEDSNPDNSEPKVTPKAIPEAGPNSEVDKKVTKTLTRTSTVTNLPYVNGAARNAVGACILGAAALLL